jgi:hypothetical protein
VTGDSFHEANHPKKFMGQNPNQTQEGRAANVDQLDNRYAATWTEFHNQYRGSDKGSPRNENLRSSNSNIVGGGSNGMSRIDEIIRERTDKFNMHKRPNYELVKSNLKGETASGGRVDRVEKLTGEKQPSNIIFDLNSIDKQQNPEFSDNSHSHNPCDQSNPNDSNLAEFSNPNVPRFQKTFQDGRKSDDPYQSYVEELRNRYRDPATSNAENNYYALGQKKSQTESKRANPKPAYQLDKHYSNVDKYIKSIGHHDNAVSEYPPKNNKQEISPEAQSLEINHQYLASGLAKNNKQLNEKKANSSQKQRLLNSREVRSMAENTDDAYSFHSTSNLFFWQV